MCCFPLLTDALAKDDSSRAAQAEIGWRAKSDGNHRMTTVSKMKEELADREAIRDCLYRYCRGIDRGDPELLRSAYWPGAMDYHTGFAGTVEEFIEWALPRLQAMQDNVHMIANILIRLDGDKAAVESYLWSVSILPGDARRQVMVAGRYLDRFERRDDEWRIAERMVVHDWFTENGDLGDWAVGPFGMSGLVRGTGGADDKSRSWLGLE
jgi:hypothetical protein